MKIHKLIEPENVYIELAADDVESALAAVADVFAPKLGLDPEAALAFTVENLSLTRLDFIAGGNSGGNGGGAWRVVTVNQRPKPNGAA